MGLTVYPLFGFPRQGANFTFSGSNWTAAWPVTNLQNDEYARVARSTGTGLGSPDLTPEIVGTSTYPIPVQTFALCAHNLTLTASYRLRLYSDTALATLVYDSGFKKAWPAARSYSGRNWSTNNFWAGQYTDAELAGQIPLLPIALDESHDVRGFRMTLRDPDNAAGYVQAGLLDVSTGYQSSSGIQLGAQDGYKSLTQTSQLLGGLERHDVYPAGYVFQGVIPFLDQDEIQNQLYELVRQMDVHTPFFFMPHPSRPLTWLRTAKMVKISDPGLFTYAAPLLGGAPLNLQEYKG